MDKKLLVLVLLSLVVFSANIGGTSIYILDEAKNAGCAMELYQRGDWAVPTFNDELRFDKPPLHYFFMKAAYSLLGITPFAARIFSSLMGVFLVVAIYFFGKRNMNGKAAFYAGLILISSLQVAFQFHLAVPDPYLIFFCTAGLLSFYEGLQTGCVKYYYFCYISLALATLAKGPVAIVLPGLIGLLFLFVQKKFTWKQIRQMQVVRGLLVFMLISLPWYIVVHQATEGVWTEQFFFKHNLNRFANTMEGHGGFPLASLVISLAALMPFSFFFPQMLRMVWRKQKENAFVQFSLLAFSVIVLFFAFSRTILPSYVGPALPFLALMLGYYFEQIIRKNQVKKEWISAAVYVLISSAIPISLYFALLQEKELVSIAWLAAWFVLLPMGAIVAFIFMWRGAIQKAFMSYVASAIVFLLVFFFFLYPLVDAQNPVTKSMTTLNKAKSIQAYYGNLNPAYVFALQHPLKKLNSPNDVVVYLQQNPLHVVVSQLQYWKEMESESVQKIYEGKDLFENPTTILISAQPTDLFSFPYIKKIRRKR
jgi:4-amino-4-deoxy-L-arabinose transferase-like glycosyltransferase